jgi:hypothetical protein
MNYDNNILRYVRLCTVALLVCSEVTIADEYESSFLNWPDSYDFDTTSSEDDYALKDCPKKCDSTDDKEPPRRALPAPFASPPFPSGEYQGSPLIGVPPSDAVYPLMKAIYNTSWGEAFKKSRIKAYGWINGSLNGSTCRKSNSPFSYWLIPNSAQLDQFIFRVEREVDSVQTDHYDIGFRSTFMYGTNYRFTTAGGWTSGQLLKRNYQYGYDFTEQYIDLYAPQFAQGIILRIGRWISTPDIETQFVPDNYMGSHSILFTFDTTTQTGIMATIMLNKNWTIQAALHAGTDMAPWYKGAVPTGMFGIRWVADDNNDSIYVVLNSINGAKFRRFQMYGQPLGHDNFNYLVGTWQHKFNDDIHTKTEGYFMWQRDAVVGGTPSAGPVRSFGGGGGIGENIPGTTWTLGVVNYTMFKLSDKDFIAVRNEVWRDTDGERSGYPGTYTSNAIGWTHNFNSIVQIRPEVGYYRNWNHKAFNLGKRNGMVLCGIDMTVRY